MQHYTMNERERTRDPGSLENAARTFSPSANSGTFQVPIREPFEPIEWQEQGLYEELDDRQPLQTLLRQTGLGIKVRFLLALTLVAVIPAIVLVLLLGDPSGQEQHASLSHALFLQAQSQAMAIDQTVQARRLAVSSLAGRPAMVQLVLGGDAGQGSASLQTAQRVDPTSLEWMIVQPNGTILGTGDTQNTLIGMQLAQIKVVSQPKKLADLVRTASAGAPSGVMSVSDDTHIRGGWLAQASPILHAQGAVLLAVFSLQKLMQGLMTVSNTLDGEVGVLLDQQGLLLASAGTLAQGQKAFVPVPSSVQQLPLGLASSPRSIEGNGLTGRTDLVVGTPVPALQGRYLLFAPLDTLLTPSTRLYFAGRNTPLLILAILVVVVLVAALVALPIVRPIRRATREIGRTTDDVRELANDARRIAHEHGVGTTILSGASRRLNTRRQSIIRDSRAIAQLCQAIQPRMRALFQAAQDNQPATDSLRVVQQAFSQIYQLGTTAADGLENDSTLKQLSNAMVSAQEIAMQFEAAGKQLEHGAEQLEDAAQTLL